MAKTQDPYDLLRNPSALERAAIEYANCRSMLLEAAATAPDEEAATDAEVDQVMEWGSRTAQALLALVEAAYQASKASPKETG